VEWALERVREGGRLVMVAVWVGDQRQHAKAFLFNTPNTLHV
jgi:threonine dehydrogenase-like Zn-dependent dehydrogenase